MGGLVILSSIIITSLLYLKDYPVLSRPVRYRRIQRHRFPGRLYKDCHEAFGGT